MLLTGYVSPHYVNEHLFVRKIQLTYQGCHIRYKQNVTVSIQTFDILFGYIFHFHELI